MILKLAMKHLVSKPFLSLFTLMAVSSALTVLGTFWTVVENLQRVKFERESDLSNNAAGPANLSIFVDSKLDAKELDSIRTRLLQSKKFSTVEIVSAEQSQKALEQQFGETLTKAMGSDILPVTLKAQFAESSVRRDDLITLMNEIRAYNGVLDIDDGSSVIPMDTMGLSSKVFSWATVMLITVFLMVALLVSHLVRIAFESLKPEVETLKVLGASKFWIFKPLLLEGLFFGICGALTSLFLLSLAVQFLLPKFSGVLFARGLEFQGLSTTSSLLLVAMAVGASVMGALFTWPLIQRSPTEI